MKTLNCSKTWHYISVRANKMVPEAFINIIKQETVCVGRETIKVLFVLNGSKGEALLLLHVRSLTILTKDFSNVQFVLKHF